MCTDMSGSMGMDILFGSGIRWPRVLSYESRVIDMSGYMVVHLMCTR